MDLPQPDQEQAAVIQRNGITITSDRVSSSYARRGEETAADGSVHGPQEGHGRHPLVNIGEAQHDGLSLLTALHIKLRQPVPLDGKHSHRAL